MAEMKFSENQEKKIDFSSQREHLRLMEQHINIISPSTKQYPCNGIEIITLIGVVILFAIRCGECCWLRVQGYLQQHIQEEWQL